LIQRGGEFHRDVVSLDRGTHVARNADETDDAAVGVAHRQLGGEAPARFVRGVPVQLQMIEKRAAGAQHDGILHGRDASKVAGTDVAGTPAEHLGFVAQPVTFHEGVVHGEITTGGVLDEEGDVRRLIKSVSNNAASTGATVRGRAAMACLVVRVFTSERNYYARRERRRQDRFAP